MVWVAGVGALVALVLWTGAAPIGRAFEAAGWGVALVCLLRVVAVAAAGLGWFALFPPGLSPARLTCVWIRFLREGANALLPIAQAGSVIGARTLALRGTSPALSAASVIVDVLVQAVTQSLFALLGLATLAAMEKGGSVAKTAAIAIVCVIPALSGFYFLQRPAGRRLVTALLTRLAGEREWLSFGAIDALYDRLETLYANRGGLLRAGVIHSGVWLFGALEVWAVLAFMGLPCGYGEALVIESLMQAVRGAAFAIPGALGAQEAGLVGLCAIFGVPAEAALAMSLIKRAPDILIGVPSLLGWQFLEGRSYFAGGRTV